MKLNNNAIIFFIFVCSLSFFVFANEAFANEIDQNIIQDIIQKFKENTSTWYSKLLNIAVNFFTLALYFEFLWVGTKSVMEGTDVRQLLLNIVQIVFFGVMFLMFIRNYQEWTVAIVNGLSNNAVDLIGGKFRADNPFQIGLDMYDKINEIAKNSDWDVKICMWLCSLLIVIIFALIASRVIVIHCEILVGLLACSLIVPFGASQTFREYAINAIRYIVSIGFKLFTMTLICGVGYTLFEYVDFGDRGELRDCLILIASSMVLLAVVFTLPDTIASLISSAHGTAGGMLQAYNTVANATTTGIMAGSKMLGAAKGSVGGVYKGTMQGIGAYKLAKESVGDAWNGMSKGQKAWSMAKSWNSAREQASMNHSPIHKQMKNMLATARALKEEKEKAQAA